MFTERSFSSELYQKVLLLCFPGTCFHILLLFRMESVELNFKLKSIYLAGLKLLRKSECFIFNITVSTIILTLTKRIYFRYANCSLFRYFINELSTNSTNRLKSPSRSNANLFSMNCHIFIIAFCFFDR